MSILSELRVANLVILLASVYLISNVAADEKIEIAKCAAITNGLERGACYDELASQLGVDKPVSSAPVTNAGKWMARQDASPIDDSKNIFLTLGAENPISGWLTGDVTPSLIIRCKEGETESYVVTGMITSSNYGETESSTVTIRLDKEKASQQTMSQSTDNKALFFRRPIKQIKSMMEHDTLLFQFIPFNSSPATTTFDLRGLPEAIKPLREACKWPK